MLDIELEDIEINSDDSNGEIVEEYLERMKKKDKKRDKCYICLSKHDKKNMINPCLTCKKPIHKDCIQRQLDYNNKRCGNCRADLPVIENKKFNTNNCCKDTWWGILGLILNIINIGSVCLMAFGLSLQDWINGIPNNDRGHYIVFLVVALFPFLSTLQFPPCCYYHIFPWFKIRYLFKCRFGIETNGDEDDEDGENSDDGQDVNVRERRHIGKSYLTTFIIIFIECCILLIAHGLGYPIMVYLFNENKFFTWHTSLAGLCILYSITLVGILIIAPIYWSVKCIVKSYTDTERRIDT
jgi:hypothetical protein